MLSYSTYNKKKAVQKMNYFMDREESIFSHDIKSYEYFISGKVEESRFLVIGGAGSIGQSLVKEIFKRNPKALHVVDINENNLVELVRDIRSSIGYIKGDFKTFVLDCGSFEFELLFKDNNKYDYILNLSALKHVRSEKDRFTLMRMIQVNIINVIKTIKLAIENDTKKYFCVSTDKATSPVNFMGASKQIMEMFLLKHSNQLNVSTARFANVAFSNGSLLNGFEYRFSKKQPIAAPKDILRYFMTHEESGQLCLLSVILGHNREIYFPKLHGQKDLYSFDEIAKWYIKSKGFEVLEVSSENEARDRSEELIKKRIWPCYFFESDTTGEKRIEEFHNTEDNIILDKYKKIGIISNSEILITEKLEFFDNEISKFKNRGYWNKGEILDLFNRTLDDFSHIEKENFLDNKM